MNYKIEVCIGSVASAIEAERGGATRVELCDNLFEGGTTPSAAVVELTCQRLNIPVYVMIRPRGGDFLYSDLDFEIMKRDISYAHKFGAAGVVFGLLCPNGTVDVNRTGELVRLAKGLKLGVTFHRAFDMCENPVKALEAVIATGCERILTSGLENKAFDGKELIKKLVTLSAGRITIMAGSGVNSENVVELVKYTGITEIHVSGRRRFDGGMSYRNSKINMGGLPGIPEYETYRTDVEAIKSIVKQLENN